MSDLFDFATDEQIEELRRLREARDAAEVEGRRMTLRAAELEHEANLAKRMAGFARAAQQEALIAAALDGTSPPEEDPQVNADTKAAGTMALVDELRRRGAAKTQEAAEIHGSLRAAVVHLASACAQAAGYEYLEAARRVRQLHATIAGAQMVLSASGQLPIVVDHEWESISIPNATGLSALRSEGVVKGAAHQRLPVVGGDAGEVRRSASRAFEAFKDSVRREVGSWPLSRE